MTDNKNLEESGDNRPLVCERICEWIDSLSRGEQRQRPSFSSPFANRIVDAIAVLWEKQLRQHREDAILDDLVRRLFEVEGVEPLLDYIYEKFRSVIPYDRIGLSFLDENNPFIAEAVYMRLDEGTPCLPTGFKADIRETSLVHVLHSGQPRSIPDLQEYLSAHPQSVTTHLLLREGIRSSLTVPLQAMGKKVGFLFFSSKQPHAYTDEHAKLLLRIGYKVSLALERARFLEMLQEQRDNMRVLLSMVSHDIRGPLSVLKGYLEMWSEGLLGPVDEAQKGVLAKMETAQCQAETLLNQLLDKALADHGKLDLYSEKQDLAELVRHQVELHHAETAAKHLEIKFSVEGTPKEVMVDRVRLCQVVDNLLSNAVKFSPLGAMIEVTVRYRPDSVVTGVRDHGVGLSPAQQAKLFRRFSTAGVHPTGNERCVGLGLAISHDIIKAHHGQMWVESSPGAGAEFFFSLPTGAH
jgi:signal transduction histidine kinase